MTTPATISPVLLPPVGTGTAAAGTRDRVGRIQRRTESGAGAGDGIQAPVSEAHPGGPAAEPAAAPTFRTPTLRTKTASRGDLRRAVHDDRLTAKDADTAQRADPPPKTVDRQRCSAIVKRSGVTGSLGTSRNSAGRAVG
ncbi:hypothetical protein ACQPZ2_19270 [Nocardia pseudovaccinii]|uniref:hypothetical protein n=1 Tax=Nocardia pseudovaccinii TaxID=189540 RepID=UPI003D8F9626